MMNKLNIIEREEILSKFEEYLNSLYCDPEIEAEYMPHYIIYKKISKKVASCYCTHCQMWYQSNVLAKSHGENGICPECGYNITYLCEGYGRKRIFAKRNFVEFKNISENETIAIAVQVRAKFYNPSCSIIVNREDVALDYDYSIANLYYFTKGQAVRFEWKNTSTSPLFDEVSYEWVETRAEREPVFERNYMGRTANNSYTIMDKDIDVLRESFLKHVVMKAEGDCTIDAHYLKFLATCSQHPNAEYLLSAGFSAVLEAKLQGRMSGLRINWRSNNLNKMLGLNKSDVKVLRVRDCTTLEIATYKELKKYFKGKATPNQMLECIGLDSDNIKYLLENTGLSLKNVLEYSKSDRIRVRDWRDYIGQCIKLGYNLSDTAISKPKKLDDAHERTTGIIISQKQEIENKELAKRNKQLQKLCYEDKQLGLKIVIPKNVQDIVNEGKRLNHCVGGYATRHVNGELNIVFLRPLRKSDVPYYTIEVSKEGNIIQCRGYRNNRHFEKPKKIEIFEARYQNYLDTIYNKKKKKVGKSA